MNINYVYSAVLLIVFSAWFNPISNRPVAPTKKEEKTRNQTARSKQQAINGKPGFSRILKDPAILGVKPGEWLPGGQCNIEFINGSMMTNKVHPIPGNNILKLAGWAMDLEKALLPDQVVVRFTDDENIELYAAGQTGFTREDVRTYFKLPTELTASGFEMSAKMEDIPSGEYAITLIAQFNHVNYICDNGRKIKVQSFR